MHNGLMRCFAWRQLEHAGFEAFSSWVVIVNGRRFCGIPV